MSKLKRILSTVLIAVLMLSTIFSGFMGNVEEASAATTTAKITKSTRVTAGGTAATYVFEVDDMKGACCQAGNQTIALKGQKCTLTKLKATNMMTKIAYVVHKEGFSSKSSILTVQYAAYICQRIFAEIFNINIAVFDESCDFFIIGVCCKVSVEDDCAAGVFAEVCI